VKNAGLLLLLTGADPKHRIKGAKIHQAGQRKNTGNDQQNDAKSRPVQGGGEIKHNEQSRQDQPDGNIGRTHIFFHDAKGLNLSQVINITILLTEAVGVLVQLVQIPARSVDPGK
jgi:hypothetical protein